jgi:hypothetical protein
MPSTASISINGDDGLTVVRDLVEEYREHASRLRELAKSHPTRNAGAVEKAIDRHERALRVLEKALIARGRRALCGLLVEEADLRWRLGNSPVGVRRPELQAGVIARRSEINRLKALGPDDEAR